VDLSGKRKTIVGEKWKVGGKSRDVRRSPWEKKKGRWRKNGQEKMRGKEYPGQIVGKERIGLEGEKKKVLKKKKLGAILENSEEKKKQRTTSGKEKQGMVSGLRAPRGKSLAAKKTTLGGPRKKTQQKKKGGKNHYSQGKMSFDKIRPAMGGGRNQTATEGKETASVSEKKQVQEKGKSDPL